MYRLKSPLSAQLELTEACNSSCLHCYNYWRYLETGKKISLKPRQEHTLEHFLRLLDFLTQNEVRTITFTGGEPFLRKDVLFDLIAKAKMAGSRVGVNTNGSLITAKDIARLKEVGVDFLLVSLASDNPIMHNQITNSKSHARASNTIESLINAGIVVHANMVVSTHNVGRIKETAMYVKGLGVKDFSATPVIPCPMAKDHLDLILSPEQIRLLLDDLLWSREHGMKVDLLDPLVHCMFNREERVRYDWFLRNRSCSAGISDIVISPNGDMRPCILATQISGNLLTDGWEKCWGNLESWCGANMLPQECLGCEVVDDCGGGCRVAAMASSGSICGKDPYMIQPLGRDDFLDLGKEVALDLDEEVVLTFPPEVFIRDEEFGCVVFWGRDFMFLDHDGKRFVHLLKERGSFTKNSLFEEINIAEDDLTNFLVSLVNRGFLNLYSSI